MKAIPFTDTMLNEQYRVFVLTKFIPSDFIRVFEGWYEKDMIGWTKLTHQDNKISFEFYGEGNPYKIKNPNLVGDKSFTLPYPKNLDQFICDCQRTSVDLQWRFDIVESMDRIVFMNQTEIEDYNKELLIKIDKE
jgi:hypothetical protein